MNWEDGKRTAVALKSSNVRFAPKGLRFRMRAMKPLVAAIFLSIAVAAQTLSPEVQRYVKVKDPVIAITHVRVIDGTGAAAKEDQTIVVRNGKIESMGTQAPPQGVKVIDANGQTAIPGLVGMHDHLFYPMGNGVFSNMLFSFPRLYLAAGVTTIRTTGSVDPYADLELKKRIDKGEALGPKMHVTGPYLEGEGTFVQQFHQIKDPEDARKTVNFWADQGVTSYKAYNFITRAELGAAIDEAHKRGIKVTGHLCSVGFREAAALGIDDLEHGLTVDTEFYPGKKPDVCPDPSAAVAAAAKLDVKGTEIQQTIKDLIAKKVAVTSTLPVFENFVAGRPPLQQRVLDAMSLDARNAYLAARVRITDDAAMKQRYGPEGSPWPAMFKREMEFEREFVRQGGLLLAGEDPTGIGGDLAGFGDQREVELLVEAGFTPLEAIKIATQNGAQFLGDDSVGTLAPGKAADIVLIKGDPSKNINDIEKVDTVFKDGIGYDSQKLIESVRGHVGIN